MSSLDFPSSDLFALVRRKGGTANWQQGQRLAEANVVSWVRGDQDEATLRVAVPGWETPPTVVLFAEGPEWGCDCGGDDPCAHIAAAVIALEASRKNGVPLDANASASATIGYRFTRAKGDLALARVLVRRDGVESPFETRVADVSIERSEADAVIERALDREPFTTMSTDDRVAVLGALSRCDDVRLDGEPVRVNDEPRTARGVLADRGDGFVLTLARDPAVREVVGRGVVRTDDGIHPIGERDLCGERMEKLPITRTFARADIPELVLDVLPTLSRRIDVDVRTAKLPPRNERAKPRVHFTLAHVEHNLSVVPRIVYGDPPNARVEGGRLVYVDGPVPVRDTDAEITLAHALRSALDLVMDRRAQFTGADAARFVQRLRAWDSSQGHATAMSLGDRVLEPRFTPRDDGFDLVFEVATPDGEPNDLPRPTASAEAVLHAAREGLDLVPLHGGGWATLPTDWIARHGHLVADLVAARDADGRIPRALRPALAELCDALERPRPPELSRLAPLAETFTNIPRADLPADVTATLRPYQREGVDWLCFLRDAGLGAVLADDMGLGKTLQAMCAFRGRTLVVCPRSLVHNWRDEIARFRPALRVAVFHGAERAIDRDADVTLTTYGVLRLDNELLRHERWDVVVLDEAQAIKNPESLAARAAFAIEADFRIALSGTPVENRLDELWSLFHFTNRGLLGGRSDFAARYGEAIAGGDPEAATRLRSRIRPLLLRRLKRDVARDLPPRTDLLMHCELSEHERAVYDAVRVATKQQVVDALTEGGKGTLAALEALLRLRQAACHPSLVPGQHAETSAKVERVVHALREAVDDGHRAIVFSQWTSMLDLLEPALRRADIAFTRLDGSTRDRGSVVRTFQDEAGPPVLIASLKAGGTGLNLTAADHVFLLDPWWNPAVEDQAADRAHRIGQTRPVMLYRVIASDTVEERILALQKSKRAIADAVLEEGGAAAASLTRDDLLALVE
jgi:superfamily II DNA or RNA helicase